jgi:hypothetical protein
MTEMFSRSADDDLILDRRPQPGSNPRTGWSGNHERFPDRTHVRILGGPRHICSMLSTAMIGGGGLGGWREGRRTLGPSCGWLRGGRGGGLTLLSTGLVPQHLVPSI